MKTDRWTGFAADLPFGANGYQAANVPHLHAISATEHDIHDAQGGPEALAVVATVPAALVLLEVHIPGRGGVDLSPHGPMR